MNEHRKVFGLVLAGGRSRRMGQDKALLKRDGQSQLQYAYSLMEELTERQFVSTRTDQQDDAERSRFPRIVDKYEDIGPIAGILSALEAHPEADWLVLACDLPNLDRLTLKYLLEHCADDKPFTAYRSRHDGLPEPLCAIYRSGSDARIRNFVEDGLVCPRKMLIRSDTELLDQPNPEALENINTPDDLAGSVLQTSQ